MKSIIHKVHIDIYKTTVFVSFDKEALVKKFDLDFSDDAGGSVFILKNGNLALWLPHRSYTLNVSDAAHECYHIADFIADRVGLVVQENTGNGHIAYLVGYMMDRVFDCVAAEEKMFS
ncbi:hypothetical protein [Photobacterium indicum]|uniref:Uncharacterized protein n=1 Tax=Photobacterium indicum TaxID=81447 RepID=A0A2T3LF61_9GAMM|nr:hypothetical protein [Photobacterium indicum]PSV50017.1 hypothetical protein C9J47_05565 [Photobacterium indicum]